MPKHTELIAYCREFVDKLMADKPGKVNYSGEDILKFSPVEAYNLIIIQNLLIQWKLELKQLESPYFNFHAPDVQEALKRFGNVLSRHILVDGNTFRNLAEKSAIQTIFLFASPYDYFNRLVQREEMKALSLEDFKETIRYVKINQHVLARFISELEKSGQQTVYGANELLDKVFENLGESPADPAPYIEQFSEILPLSEEIIFPGEDMDEKGEADNDHSGNIRKPLTSPGTGEDEYKGGLNEKLSGERRPTLADIHKQKKIEDIRQSLTLNQRYMFINSLFKGDEGRFNEVVETLEQRDSYQDAKQWLKENHSWDFESEEVLEFLEIVERRLN